MPLLTALGSIAAISRYFVTAAISIPAGQGRLDILGYTAEISYGLALGFRGKGLGRILLTLLEEKVRTEAQAAEVTVLYGQVKQTNQISRRLFLNLGFREVMESEKSGEMMIYKKVVK